MSINLEDLTFEFTVEKFLAYPMYQNLEKVIFQMSWTYVCTYNGPDGRVFRCESKYISDINTDDIVEFVPFQSLTKEIVSGWIEKIDNIDTIRIDMLNNINGQINMPPPRVINLIPPF